ncbi:MAG: acyltransferase family protein [Thermoanaerobaculia bacterium]
MPSTTPASRPPADSREGLASPGRFHLVDGLRGLAALWVLSFHLVAPPLAGGLVEGFALPIRALTAHGWLGVQTFFVLSGFVIAHSLRNVSTSPDFLARFVARRSVRLDPPYWMAIAAAVCSIYFSNWIIPERTLRLPGPGEIASHLVYLQEILGYEQLVDVFWTLCIEFQLYLVLAVLLVLGQLTGRVLRSARTRQVIGWLFLATTIAMSLLSTLAPGGPTKVWFFPYWYQFFLGALTYWTIMGRSSRASLVLLGCAVLGAGLLSRPDQPLASLGTASILYLAGRTGSLGTWLSSRPFRFLGAISYSLYLTHTLVFSRGCNLMTRLGYLPGNEWPAAIVLVAAALLVATIWNRLFERPSLKWSRKISLDHHRLEVRPSRTGSASSC